MRTALWLLSAITLVAVSPAARAQLSGTINPWQQGRRGLPPGYRGFDPFGQRRGIPGLPWTPAGRDPSAIPGVPGVPRVLSVRDLVNDPQNGAPVTLQPLDPVKVPQLPPEALAPMLQTEVPKLELLKPDPPHVANVLRWLLPVLLGLGYLLSEMCKEPKEGKVPAGWQGPPGPAGQPVPVAVPPLEELILRPEEVEGKARRTGRLLAVLADHDALFNPWDLRAWIATLFHQVQQCRQERDFGPVRELLMPHLCAQHEELLRDMRRNGESNRIDDLSIRRLEFVHVSCPEDSAEHEVTALITFDARVYFVSDLIGAFLRGARKVIPYQEFWVFRRQGNAWRLHGIEQSFESDRLEAANRVAAMTDEALRNAEDGVLVVP